MVERERKKRTRKEDKYAERKRRKIQAAAVESEGTKEGGKEGIKGKISFPPPTPR